MKPLLFDDNLNLDNFKNTKKEFSNGILSSLKKDNKDFPNFDDLFFLETPFPTISQEKTGYCWLMSTLHCIINYTQKKYEKKDIYFSKNYLIFWDKVEKANWFLEHIIELLPKTTEDKAVRYLLNRAMSDRGQWNMARNLIEKYGLIPYEVMTNNVVSQSTGECNACLSMVLRCDAFHIHNLYKKGTERQKLILEKEKMLKDIISLLCSIFGIPPTLIKCPYYVGGKVRKKISPADFYHTYIDFPFEDYISIFNDGKNTDKLYITDYVMLDGNVIGGKDNSFLHVTEDIFYKSILTQVTDSIPCWFGCDTGKFSFWNMGIYDDSSFELKRFSKTIEQYLTKSNINKYNIASMTHAMTMMRTRCYGQKRWWESIDSSEPHTINGNRKYLSDSWFKKYVFQAVVQKNYLLKYDISREKKQIVAPWDFFNLGAF